MSRHSETDVGVGVLQQPLDPRLGVDVAVGVRVEDQLDAGLLLQDLAEPGHAA